MLGANGEQPRLFGTMWTLSPSASHARFKHKRTPNPFEFKITEIGDLKCS